MNYDTGRGGTILILNLVYSHVKITVVEMYGVEVE